MGDGPFLEIGIGDRHEIDQEGLGGIALLQEIGDGGFGVFAFAKLPLVAVVEFHDGRDVGVFRRLPS